MYLFVITIFDNLCTYSGPSYNFNSDYYSTFYKDLDGYIPQLSVRSIPLIELFRAGSFYSINITSRFNNSHCCILY